MHGRWRKRRSRTNRLVARHPPLAASQIKVADRPDPRSRKRAVGRFITRRNLAGLSLLLTVALICTRVLARAGGGHGFSGGGGGHGGGGGGGGGDILDLIIVVCEVIYWIGWLCIAHPFIGIPAVLISVMILYRAGSGGTDAYKSNVIKRGSDAIDASQRQAMIDSLKQSDPDFDPGTFYARVCFAFTRTQEAWSARKMENVRAFISDGVFERFNLQIDEQKSLGYRNQMENVDIRDTQIAQVFSDRLFDTISVRITASADDYNVSIEDGSRLATNATGKFVEIWSFLRRRGAKTKSGQPGLIEGNCPNCGAPIEMNQNANCASCKALLRSGEFDWVLSEITQECEWQADQTRTLPGVEAFSTRDKNFNLQELEDRAGVIFWRWVGAKRQGSERLLRGVALPDFLANLKREIGDPPPPGRSYPGECAVGSVQTLGVIEGSEMDRALVEIAWTGTRFVMKEDGPNRTDEKQLTRSVFVLARKTGSVTNLAQAISSAHCPNCGAALGAGGDSGACEFCGTLLNDGSQGWVLSEIIAPGDAKGMLRGTILSAGAAGDDGDSELSAPSAAGLLSWMTLMAVADGNVSRDEMEMLIGTARRHNIPRERVDEMIRAGLQSRLDSAEPENQAESRIWLRAMARSALADGNLTRQEKKLLRATGEKLGLVEYDIDAMLTETKSEMYREAKKALRERSNGVAH